MKNVIPALAAQFARLPVIGRDHVQGAAEAPLVLLEYGDYECPFCGSAYPEVKRVQAELGAELRFAFRNFPLGNLHPHARHAAEAAEAAAAHGRFWAMHDLLFENQDALEDDDLTGYAKALQLDPSQLLAEILRGDHTARVLEDFRTGVRGGVNGTPTFFVNGHLYLGPIDADSLIHALRRARTAF